MATTLSGVDSLEGLVSLGIGLIIDLAFSSMVWYRVL